MEQIASFKVNHDKLDPGFYLSRQDKFESNLGSNFTVYTYDLRLCKPNTLFTLNNLQMHSAEHLVATAARELYSDNVLYFGPMGCATGFYLLTNTPFTKEDVINILDLAYSYDRMPGQSSVECGNYRNLSLDAGKEVIQYYAEILLNPECPTIYPE